LFPGGRKKLRALITTGKTLSTRIHHTKARLVTDGGRELRIG
jgi:hypothetical protein